VEPQNKEKKQGFCIQSTGREINSRQVPITSPYNDCTNQGVEIGWSDSYNLGIPCQWFDVTSYNTASTSVNITLTETVNPKNWLCEGTAKFYANGTHKWVSTGEISTNPPYPTAGLPIDKYECVNSPGFSNNNVESTPVKLTKKGTGIITQPCRENGFVFGPKRDCEFNIKDQDESCTPGQPVALVCSIPQNDKSQVLRVCESSIALGRTGTACRYNDDFTLANVVVSPNTNTTVSFKCPSRRDNVEIGGVYSLYQGAVFNGVDNDVAITCRAYSI